TLSLDAVALPDGRGRRDLAGARQQGDGQAQGVGGRPLGAAEHQGVPLPPLNAGLPDRATGRGTAGRSLAFFVSEAGRMKRVFSNGTIILADRLVQGGSVETERERITAVRAGPAKAAAGAEVVDLDGGYLCPG